MLFSCTQCGKEFKRKSSQANRSENHFCSRSCSAVYNGHVYPKRKKKTRYCLYCNKILNNRHGKYCGPKCKSNKYRDDYINKWLRGKVSGKKGTYQVSNYVRNYLLETNNYSCSICGWSKKNKFSNTYPLVIDHIDGNSSNNTPKNLRIICPNCDSLTSTYKGLNKGSGRFSRRERYRLNKSY